MIFQIAYHLDSFSGLAVRGSSLQARIDKLAVKVSTFYIIHYIVDLPPLFIFQLFLGDPAGLQCWGGDSSRDPTEESFPLHSELWPTGEWSFVLKENPQERILQSIPQKIQWKAIDGFAIYCLGLIIRQNSFTLSSPRSYPEKQCQSLCWNSTSPVTSRLPWTNSILIGEIIFSPQLCLHHQWWFTIVIQGGWQRWTEVLHWCKLLLRPVALRNAAVHWEGQRQERRAEVKASVVFLC